MVRLLNAYFPPRTLLLAFSESVLAFVALLLATLVWFGSDADLALTYDHGPVRLLFASAVWVLCMYYYGLYESWAFRRPLGTAVGLMQVLGTVCVVLALVYFAYPGLQLGRGPLVIWILLSVVVLAAWRRAFFLFARATRMVERVALVGEGPLAQKLAAEIEARPEFGLQVVGPAGTKRAEGAGAAGPVDNLEQWAACAKVSSFILAPDDRPGASSASEILRLKAKGFVVRDGLQLYQAITGRVPIELLTPSWLLLTDGIGVSRFAPLLKRAVSAPVAFLALLVGLPLMVLIALVVRLDSPGPVIFRQKRVGKGGRFFTLFKFRSMREDADPARPAQEDDDRITRVGRWLRRTRLDELPQLYNILRGDMDFVGPRPCIPGEEAEYARQIPFYSHRWTVQPGVTGWAQVHNGYCASLEDHIEKLGYDLYYIKHMSVGLDLLILFQTTKILLLGRGAR